MSSLDGSPDNVIHMAVTLLSGSTLAAGQSMHYYYYSRLSTFDAALVADASEGEVTIVTSESKGLSILFWFIAH